VSAVTALLRADGRTIRRDTLLLPLAFGLPLLIALARFGVPALASWLDGTYGFDLVPYYPWIVGAVFVIDLPMNLGGLMALMVLEERDDGTLSALQVTPLGLGGYAGYRLALAIGLSAVVLLAGVPLTGLLPGPVLTAALPAVLPACLMAAAAALGVLLLADNKVEGLAIMKGLGALYVLPLLGWFVDSRWEVLLALVPTWWPLQALWAAADGRSPWGYAVGGTVYLALLLALLLARFARTIGR
jgi:fluoroquinolone transport system permease protein